MSRPTKIQHLPATLRKAIHLGRDQMSARSQMSRPALEKVERGRNPFRPLLRERVFGATGVCPGWLATPDGPIHSYDGYPFDCAQLTRCERWRDQPSLPAAPESVVTGIVGQKLGPLYRRTCYPGPARILAHAPVEAVGGSLLTASQWQRHMQREQRHRMAADLVDCVHEATLSAFNDWENGQDRLRHLVAALDRLFPGILPVRYSKDTEAEIDLNPMSRCDFQLALKKPSTQIN